MIIYLFAVPLCTHSYNNTEVACFWGLGQSRESLSLAASASLKIVFHTVPEFYLKYCFDICLCYVLYVLFNCLFTWAIDIFV